MSQIAIEARRREASGKNANRRIRVAGSIPAVIYGPGKESIPLLISPGDLSRIMHSESGQNTIFVVNVDGSPHANAMIKDYQLDPVKGNLIHADFIEIAMDRLLEVTVEIEPVGDAEGVKVGGGIMDFVTRSVEVECLPGDIPDSIKVDVSHLKINDYVRVKNLQVNENDRPGDAGPTAADSAAPFLRLYAPLDLLDWLTNDQGELTACCLQEMAPRADFTEFITKPRVREVGPDGWALREGTVVLEAGSWYYAGRVPVELLYGQRRALVPVVGQSILGDPKLFVDVYNLTSEIRELLRSQTFSLLNVPLGTGADAITVEQAKAMSSEVVGTENAFFSGHTHRLREPGQRPGRGLPALQRESKIEQGNPRRQGVV